MQELSNQISLLGECPIYNHFNNSLYWVDILGKRMYSYSDHKLCEYLFDKKYFNISTNNIHLWKDKLLPKPDINEDTFAKNNNEYYNESIETDNSIKNEQPIKKKIILSKNNLLLVKRKN